MKHLIAPSMDSLSMTSCARRDYIIIHKNIVRGNDWNNSYGSVGCGVGMNGTVYSCGVGMNGTTAPYIAVGSG